MILIDIRICKITIAVSTQSRWWWEKNAWKKNNNEKTQTQTTKKKKTKKEKDTEGSNHINKSLTHGAESGSFQCLSVYSASRTDIRLEAIIAYILFCLFVFFLIVFKAYEVDLV